MSHFDEALEEVFRAEGGLLISDGEGAPGTKGGGANFGITLTTLREWRNDPSLDLESLKVLSKEEAALIYKTRYWDALGLDAVTGVWTAIIMMDQAVNRGLGGIRSQARATLEKRFSLKTATMPEVIAAVNSLEDQVFAKRLLMDTQLAYIEIAISNPEKLKNLRGWIIRTHNLLKQMA